MGALTMAVAAVAWAGAFGAVEGAVAGVVMGVAAGVLVVAVTGAGGYLGREVVRALLRRGHRVRALLRGGEAPEGPGDVEEHRLDLATDPIGPALRGCDAVVHAAGALTGDEAVMARDTVEATRRLVAAAGEAGVGRLVLASSVAVYAASRPGETVAEDSALEPLPRGRDAYARAKLAQEGIVREAGLPEAWLLRIGHLWGPGRMEGAPLGPRLGPRTWPLRLSVAEGPLPLAHVAHAGLACALACETPVREPGDGPGGVEVVNVLDADLPDAQRWLRATGEPALFLPWQALDAAAGFFEAPPDPASAWGAPQGVRRRLPHLLRRPSLRARAMPRAWPVDRLRERLGWAPLGTFEEMARWPA